MSRTDSVMALAGVIHDAFASQWHGYVRSCIEASDEPRQTVEVVLDWLADPANAEARAVLLAAAPKETTP
jgi:hypothetical protein